MGEDDSPIRCDDSQKKPAKAERGSSILFHCTVFVLASWPGRSWKMIVFYILFGLFRAGSTGTIIYEGSEKVYPEM